jgi:hypothetical protein
MVKKNCEAWRKMGLFGPDSDPANQLHFQITFTAMQKKTTPRLAWS